MEMLVYFIIVVTGTAISGSSGCEYKSNNDAMVNTWIVAYIIFERSKVAADKLRRLMFVP